MKENHFIANIKQSDFYHYFNLYIMNRYAIVFLLFLIWIIFIDESNLLLQNKLNQQIDNLNTQKEYYKNEVLKNDTLYKTLNNNQLEREKYARENYFMKKDDEDIFILVVDSSKTDKKLHHD